MKRPTYAPSARAPAGFTLLELLVVLAMLVLLTGLLPMALNRALPGRRVEATVLSLSGVLNRARELSVALAVPIALRLETHRLTPIAAEHIPVGEATWTDSTQVRAAELTGNAEQIITVYPDGSVSEARVAVSEGRRRAVLSISPVTGRLSIARTTG